MDRVSLYFDRFSEGMRLPRHEPLRFMARNDKHKSIKTEL